MKRVVGEIRGAQMRTCPNCDGKGSVKFCCVRVPCHCRRKPTNLAEYWGLRNDRWGKDTGIGISCRAEWLSVHCVEATDVVGFKGKVCEIQPFTDKEIEEFIFQWVSSSNVGSSSSVALAEDEEDFGPQWMQGRPNAAFKRGGVGAEGAARWSDEPTKQFCKSDKDECRVLTTKNRSKLSVYK